jgi:MSHA biogenesis protein MshK
MSAVVPLGAAALLAALALAGTASAQAALGDPTRPPNIPPGPVVAGEEALPRPGVAPSPRLQSVLISPNRRVAVIDGRTVALGGNIGGAILVQIAETHVTLRTGGETTVLELHPGVGRKPATMRDAKKKNKEGLR